MGKPTRRSGKPIRVDYTPVYPRALHVPEASSITAPALPRPAARPTPALKPGDVKILEALKQARPATLKLDDLEALAGLSCRTLSGRVRSLIKQGLAVRPLGARAGVTITSAGLAALTAG